MNFFTAFRFLRIKKKIILLNQGIQANNYASKGVKGSKKSSEKYVRQESLQLPVEKDVDKLLKYCCGTNLLKEGQDVELKPDSEYPEWLWNIRTGRAPRLHELDPNTKEYWRLSRKIGIKRTVMLKSLRKK